MKQTVRICLCLATMFLIAIPAPSEELKLDGSYYVEGVLNTNENMNEEDASSHYYQMRLRVEGEYTVNERLKLFTRFDALEKEFSSYDSAFPGEQDERNIDFDRAWMQIDSPIGRFLIGRQAARVWGTTWADDETEGDKLVYQVPLQLDAGTLYLGAAMEKVLESDAGPLESNSDNDRYFLGAIYQENHFRTGLLFGLYKYRDIIDTDQVMAKREFDLQYPGMESPDAVAAYREELLGFQSALIADGGTPGPNTLAFLQENPDFQGHVAALGKPVSAGGDAGDPLNIFAERSGKAIMDLFLLAPFYSGKLGPFQLETEIDYVWGDFAYPETDAAPRKVNAFSGFAELSYAAGPVTLELGYAHVSGDSDYGDEEINSFGTFRQGSDWAKMFILSSDYHGMEASLAGGVGNHIGVGEDYFTRGLLDGYRMGYTGAEYAVFRNLTAGARVGMAWADDVPEGVDDYQGVETNLTLRWKLWDNLEYWAVAAWLHGGDYWKERGEIPDDAYADNCTLFHRLTLTF